MTFKVCLLTKLALCDTVIIYIWTKNLGIILDRYD